MRITRGEDADSHYTRLSVEMAEIEIKASQWRLVEVGRVVLFTHGPFTGRLATIVEIIDHKRVCHWNQRLAILRVGSRSAQALVDGPSKKEHASVPRQSVSLNNLIITPIVIPKLPRQAGRGAVARAWEKEEVESKWDESAWAKRREQREKRRNLSDFDRFKVLRLKKQVCANNARVSILGSGTEPPHRNNSYTLYNGGGT